MRPSRGFTPLCQQLVHRVVNYIHVSGIAPVDVRETQREPLSRDL